MSTLIKPKPTNFPKTGWGHSDPGWITKVAV